MKKTYSICFRDGDEDIIEFLQSQAQPVSFIRTLITIAVRGEAPVRVKWSEMRRDDDILEVSEAPQASNWRRIQPGESRTIRQLGITVVNDTDRPITLVKHRRG